MLNWEQFFSYCLLTQWNKTVNFSSLKSHTLFSSLVSILFCNITEFFPSYYCLLPSLYLKFLLFIPYSFLLFGILYFSSLFALSCFLFPNSSLPVLRFFIIFLFLHFSITLCLFIIFIFAYFLLFLLIFLYFFLFSFTFAYFLLFDLIFFYFFILIFIVAFCIFWYFSIFVVTFFDCYFFVFLVTSLNFFRFLEYFVDSS